MEQRIGTNRKLGRRLTVADRLDFGKESDHGPGPDRPATGPVTARNTRRFSSVGSSLIVYEEDPSRGSKPEPAPYLLTPPMIGHYSSRMWGRSRVHSVPRMHAARGWVMLVLAEQENV